MRTLRRQFVMLALPLTFTALLAASCSSESTSASTSTATPEPRATPVTQLPAAAAGSLAGSAWTLTVYVAEDGASTAGTPAPEAGTLAFTAKGTVSGSTGCNAFNGTYTQRGSSLTITVGPMTMRACAGVVAAQETAVLANLAKVSGFSAASSLKLFDGTKVVLTYKAISKGLAGTAWVASGINNGKGGVEGNAGTSKVTANFDSEGGLSGNGGCNSYTASYTTSGRNDIKIGPAISTMMACEPASLMTTEQQYFAALGKVSTYMLDGNHLTMRDAAGATQISFIPAS